MVEAPEEFDHVFEVRKDTFDIYNEYKKRSDKS
jgi:hypothetical protein